MKSLSGNARMLNTTNISELLDLGFDSRSNCQAEILQVLPSGTLNKLRKSKLKASRIIGKSPAGLRQLMPNSVNSWSRNDPKIR